ncbi:MAG: GGDEF domain-containing protein [Hyphomicrobiales bacterium]|nr:GGDEF domain-containing protein [Hyphomicrobiales bacterium]
MPRSPLLAEFVGASATVAAAVAALPAVAFYIGWERALADALPVWLAGAARHETVGGALLLFASGVCATLAFEWIARRGYFRADETENAVADDLELSSRQFDMQLAGALEAFSAHAERTGQYADALRQGRVRLEAANNAERVRAVVCLLVAENDKMAQANATARERLNATTNELKALRAKLNRAKAESERDGLTNAFSRRHFDVVIADEVARARSRSSELSLVMADIDHFKAINDTHGHPVGDEFLKQFAAVLARNARTGDCVARYGGEEFAIVMPATTLEAAASVAERIRLYLTRTRWRRGRVGGEMGTFTASFGVAALAPGEDAAALIERADARLYASKRAGRNRVSK